MLCPDVNEVPSELGSAQQSCTKHEAVTKREDNNMAQGNFMASKSSQRAQTGPESVHCNSPIDLCLGSISHVYELPKPLGAQRQNGSLGKLVPIADFY